MQVLVQKETEENRILALSTRALEPTPGDMLHNPQAVYDNAERMAEIFRSPPPCAEGKNLSYRIATPSMPLTPFSPLPSLAACSYIRELITQGRSIFVADSCLSWPPVDHFLYTCWRAAKIPSALITFCCRQKMEAQVILSRISQPAMILEFKTLNFPRARSWRALCCDRTLGARCSCLLKSIVASPVSPYHERTLPQCDSIEAEV